MKCELFRELILDYVTGNLGREPLRDFKTHWTGCPECAEMLRAVEGHEALFAALPRPRPTPDLWMRIQRETSDCELLRMKPFNVRFMRWFVAAAAVALITVTTLTTRPHSRTLPVAHAPIPGGLNITVIDVKDRADAGALGRFVPTYDAADPTAALDSVMREK